MDYDGINWREIMATGSITTLGIGSGLDLQNILDQLKDVEKAPIKAKENKKAELQKEINAYNSVNAKLFAMKSNTLGLSLESNFLKNSASVSDEEILTATTNDGIAESSQTIEVIRKARHSSFQSQGVANKDAVLYAKPETTILSPTVAATTKTETMTIQYGAAGEQQSINISITQGMSLDQITDRINASGANKNKGGAQLVTASVESNKGKYYIRLADKSGGNSAESQISVKEGFDYVAADTTVAISQAKSDSPMYVSIAAGTTYEETASLINSAPGNPGVKAAMVNTGEPDTPFRLTLTSEATGEENRISIQNLTLTEVTGADTDGDGKKDSLNSEFTVNGISYQRQSNDGIDDVISGVTLNFKKVGETSLGVQKSLDSVKENITSLIDGFNKLVSEIRESSTADTTETDSDKKTKEIDNPLKDSYDVKALISNLTSLVSTSVNSDSAYSSLFDLGLEIDRNGTMSLNETVLDQAIASNPEAVKDLFIGDATKDIKGLGDIIDDGIAEMVNSQSLISTQVDAAQTRIKRLDQDILTATERLDKRYQTMARDFVKLDTYVSKLNNQSAYMKSVFDSFNTSQEK
jgi:flagellar hook-associated protein 2